MNTVAQRKIPEEWTPEMWQAHVTDQEKRISDLENKFANMSNITRTETMQIIQAERSKGACLV